MPAAFAASDFSPSSWEMDASGMVFSGSSHWDLTGVFFSFSLRSHSARISSTLSWPVTCLSTISSSRELSCSVSLFFTWFLITLISIILVSVATGAFPASGAVVFFSLSRTAFRPSAISFSRLIALNWLSSIVSTWILKSSSSCFLPGNCAILLFCAPSPTSCFLLSPTLFCSQTSSETDSGCAPSASRKAAPSV